MANAYAIASGNWSATSTWNGGVLPGTTDTVCANGFTVTIDGSASNPLTVGTIQTAANSPAVAGGGFTTALAALALHANVLSGTTVCLTYTGTGTLAITGTITGGSVSAGYGVSNTSTGTVTVAGNVAGGTYSGNGGYGVNNGSTGTVAVTGTVTSGSGPAIFNGSTGAVTVAGNVTGGSANQNSVGILNNASGPVGVTGNVTGGGYASGGGYGINGGTGVVTVVGNINPGSGLGSCGVYSTATVSVTGSIGANANGTAGTCCLALFVGSPASQTVGVAAIGGGTYSMTPPPTPSQVSAAIWAQVIDGGQGAIDVLTILMAALAGQTSVNTGTSTVTFYAQNGSTAKASVTYGPIAGQRTCNSIS